MLVGCGLWVVGEGRKFEMIYYFKTSILTLTLGKCSCFALPLASLQSPPCQGEGAKASLLIAPVSSTRCHFFDKVWVDKAVKKPSTDPHKTCNILRLSHFLLTINRFIWLIALAGFNPLGHESVQFIIVWQR